MRAGGPGTLELQGAASRGCAERGRRIRLGSGQAGHSHLGWGAEGAQGCAGQAGRELRPLGVDVMCADVKEASCGSQDDAGVGTQGVGIMEGAAERG